MSEYLTTKELAKRLGITLAALRKRMIAAPHEYPREMTPRGYRFKASDVQQMPHGDLRKQRGVKHLLSNE